MLHVRKNLLKAFVLLALTPGLTTDLNAQDWSVDNAQAEEKQGITVEFNPKTGLLQQLFTPRPAAHDVRTTHNVPFSNKQVEVNWSQLNNGGMTLASFFTQYKVTRMIDEEPTTTLIKSWTGLILPLTTFSTTLMFGYRYLMGDQIFRVVHQQEEASSQEA